MRDIFVSYRRSDSSDITGRIFDQMKIRFGEDRLFKDVDSIPLGMDFRAAISEAVGQCQVLLAVIGKDWLEPTGNDGQRRIDDPNDYVHLEIATALSRRIPVVPVLVGNTAMPQSANLPEPLKDLAFRNGARVRSDPDFHRDINRLCLQLAEYLSKRRTWRPVWSRETKFAKLGTWGLGGVAILAILVLAVISYLELTKAAPAGPRLPTTGASSRLVTNASPIDQNRPVSDEEKKPRLEMETIPAEPRSLQRKENAAASVETSVPPTTVAPPPAAALMASEQLGSPAPAEPQQKSAGSASGAERFKETNDLIVIIEHLSEQAVDTYEQEGGEAALLKQLQSFNEAAIDLRKAFRKATGTGLRGNLKNIMRRTGGGQATEAEIVEAKAEDLIKRGEELSRILGSELKHGPTLDYWKEIQGKLKELDLKLDLGE